MGSEKYLTKNKIPHVHFYNMFYFDKSLSQSVKFRKTKFINEIVLVEHPEQQKKTVQ